MLILNVVVGGIEPPLALDDKDNQLRSVDFSTKSAIDVFTCYHYTTPLVGKLGFEPRSSAVYGR